MLVIDNLSSRYGRIEVLHGLSLEVKQGEIVTLVGSNGAGKTTLLRAISGVQPVFGGSIRFLGEAIDRAAPHVRVARGIAQVPEGRQVFSPLSVEDNLRLGAWSRKDNEIATDIQGVYATFPVLAEKRAIAAGSLSGGQQQMLAMGRALMARPKLMLLDEPSMGLAPLVISRIFDVIRDINRSGVTIVLVEQNATQALRVAHRAYVLEKGRVRLSGSAAAIRRDPIVVEAYLGGSKQRAAA